jgi:F-type H+-transporting ATPase subunit b
MGVSKAVLVLLVGFAVAAAHPPAIVAAEEHGATGEKHLADEHASDAGHGEPNPLAVKPDLMIWTWIVFVILLAVLWKFAWGPISQALDLREQKIADNIAAAEQCNVDAKKLLAEYEAKLAAAREEVRGILDEARRDAEHAGQEIVAKARADAQGEVQRGKHEIETATAQALNELAKSSANLAVELAGRIVSAKLNASDHARLIDEALANFPKGDHSRN